MLRFKRGVSVDLQSLLEDKFFPLRTQVGSEVTRRRYRRAVRWLGESIGRAATLAELTDDNLAAVATYLKTARNQSARTINGTLECLRTLWRWCRDRELARGGPTFAPLKVAQRIPRAWKEDELDRLCQAAAASVGSIGGMPARTWWLTLLALEMDTGARAGELLALRWEWIDWQRGTLTVDASVRKGSVAFACYGLRAETLAWLDRHRKPEGLILGWDLHPSRYYQLWRDLLVRAGLPNSRYTKTHQLRRTFATLLERHGGDATRALGHASRATTLTHYIDPSEAVTTHAAVIPFHPLTCVSREMRQA